jgi:hypothetical protein
MRGENRAITANITNFESDPFVTAKAYMTLGPEELQHSIRKFEYQCIGLEFYVLLNKNVRSIHKIILFNQLSLCQLQYLSFLS